MATDQLKPGPCNRHAVIKTLMPMGGGLNGMCVGGRLRIN